MPEYVEATAAALAGLRSGTAVFAVPPEPSSCGGTVLKALFLAAAAWEQQGVLEDIDVHVVTPYSRLLDRPTVDDELDDAAARLGITVHPGAEASAVERDGAGERLHRYDGYTVIPVATSRTTLALDEHDRAGKNARSVPLFDTTRERPSVYAFDRYVQPQVYFRGILTGRV
ncbi:MAG: hypothetical protein Q4G34_10875 [Micrococcus sp.]|nr:hypothetical protein [Micrococcus sp.]